MHRPAAIPAKLGFYLLLLFSFSVSIYPEAAYIIAAVAFCVWLVQMIVFRQFLFLSSPLLFPISGLAAFCVILWLLSKIISFHNPTLWAGLYSVFYFTVMSFVPSEEKRKMIIWTFLSGVILASAVRFLSGLETEGFLDLNNLIFSDHLPVLIIMAFCLSLAYFSESIGFKEKIFFGLIFLPVGIGIVAMDSNVAPLLLAVLLVVGFIKDRTILAIVGLAAIIILAGASGIEDKIDRFVTTDKLTDIAEKPLTAVERNLDQLKAAEFYGSSRASVLIEDSSTEAEPFFISLIMLSGPPSFLLFIWVFYELVRRDLAMVRKLNIREEKVFHLATLLTVIVLVLANTYGSTFGDSPAILGLWMLLGMAEV